MKVIGIFGGSSAGDLESERIAVRVGGDIASQSDWIVLTGGDDPGGPGVKNKALTEPNEPPGNGWVGVTRAETVECREVERGLVLRTDLGHQRNYLEACLIDAAVVLPGETGTISEAVAALCLGKPVVFLGDGWMTSKYWTCLAPITWETPLDDATRAKWIELAMRRLGENQESTIGHLIRRDIRADNLRETRNRIAYLPSERISETVAILESLFPPSPTHAFPNLVGDAYLQLKAGYEAFVARQDEGWASGSTGD
jgi:uncharacterized protein (TIGR00725 family)